ncbi:hypothetical protein [Legionella fairfieldensis]|uniref:hypothetical protein n=1 Tax=Legionella fairfieldensis TaxID=45064 RepID=UPI00048D670C|nr:hypothetical protein [Legionella fairfieldensis]
MAGLVFMMMVGTGFADNAALNETLVRLINQINAMMPLLDEASEETESNARLVFHIDSFIGPDGKKRAGVRDDLLAIRNSLIEFINQPAVAPKTIKPLALDYVGKG